MAVRGRLKRRQLTDEVRREVIRLAGQGHSYKQILAEVDISVGSITNVLRPLGGVIRSDTLAVTGRRLSLDDRASIHAGLAAGGSFRSIAAGIGRAPSTVSREVNSNGGRAGYRLTGSHRRAHQAARRPKPTKLAANPALRDRVERELRRLWSPEQIARGLRAEFGAGSVHTVSHETIYKSLYVQARGELRRELTSCLRTGRASRKPHGRLHTQGRIAGMVLISQRPAEIADRAVPGHWEGDLIVGAHNKSCIATLVVSAIK